MSEIMSERLKELRKEKGLTQQQVANALNMSRTTLSKYENKDTDIDVMPVRELMRLSKYYNCDPRYITGDISCKDKEVSDIHDATGLTDEPIRVMKEMHSYEGHVLECAIGIDFINCMIGNIPTELLLSLIKSKSWMRVFERANNENIDAVIDYRMLHDNSFVECENIADCIEFDRKDARNIGYDLLYQLKEIIDVFSDEWSEELADEIEREAFRDEKR